MSGNVVTIGSASEHFGVSLRAIRFYEQRGLLKTKRNGGNRRVLDDVAMKQLSYILELKKRGLTLSEIGTAFQVAKQRRAEPKLTLDQIRTQLSFLQARRAEVDEQIARLQAELK